MRYQHDQLTAEPPAESFALKGGKTVKNISVFNDVHGLSCEGVGGVLLKTKVKVNADLGVTVILMSLEFYNDVSA